MGNKPTNTGPATTSESTEDPRITSAREALAESMASTSVKDREAYSAARWHGRLEATVQTLLHVIDEGTERDRVHVALVGTLETVRDSLDAMIDQRERLGRIEDNVSGILRVLSTAVETAEQR